MAFQMRANSRDAGDVCEPGLRGRDWKVYLASVPYTRSQEQESRGRQELQRFFWPLFLMKNSTGSLFDVII